MISVDETAKPRSKYVSTLKSITPGTDGLNNTEDDFLSCAELGDYPRLQQCIDNHVYINCKDSDGGLTALHAASGWGHLDCAALLLNKGANVLASDKERQTALHSAAKGNHVSVVHLLLDKEANINAVDTMGRTPLYYACRHGHTATVAALIERHCDTTVPTKTRDDHLHIAAQMGRLDICTLLLDNGARVEAYNEHKSQGEQAWWIVD